ncbi:MAG: AAA family ATPase [Pseudomonadales bacterium]
MTSTEADALQNILSWSKDRPAWQRDALRRLVVQGELNEDDIDQLTLICREAKTPFDPLSSDHIGAQQKGAPTVALRNIRNVQNVNALAENQTLNLIPKGLTIVYGDNGAGKSGYVRILKKVCRARVVVGREEPILPNIHDTQTGPQRAELEYNAGAQVQKTEWKSGSSSDVLLSEISVFDSRTANVHVEEANDLAYTPYPMKLIERLVDACKGVKAKLDDEIRVLREQTPQSISNPPCSVDTETGKLIAALGKGATAEQVEGLATISDGELARIAELTADFANDPSVTARRLRAQKSRLENLRDKLKTLEASVSSENGEKLSVLKSELITKTDAARIARQNFAQDEPLSGLGSTTWKALWEAARAYSMAEAYPDEEFPNTDPTDSRCVLCHQYLDESAAQRLQRFESFVRDHTQQEEANAVQALRLHRQGLIETDLSYEYLRVERAFLADELGNIELERSLKEFAIRTRWRLRAMLRANSDVDHPTPQLNQVGLDAAISALETRATALLADENNEERTKLREELNELKDRQWLAGVKADVLSQMSRLETVAALTTALQDTRHNEITSKNTLLSKELITERLRARFAREIDHFNLAGLAIELKQTQSKAGVSRFKVGLIEDSTHNAAEILSEGEFRCVALASFMAELATNDSESGIIFDDPVSSLDHLHREAIAKRLAEEGKCRQVVVFTHDLPFLFLLRNACTQVEDPAEKTEIALRHIQKRQSTPGHCRNEPPEKAQSASGRLNSMRSHLSNTRIKYDQDPDGTDWLITARGLIDSLRQTWETAVEDAISPVLRTFSSRVNTKGFARLSAITQEDAEIMRKHYGQCSVLLHKASDALNPVAPSPEAIEDEMDALESWLTSVSQRQDAIKVN